MPHSKKISSILFPLPAILLMIHLATVPAMAEDQETRQSNKCDVHQGPCTTTLLNGTITLDINPKPVKSMKDLTFRLEVSGTQPTSSPHIDLGMPGMNMGPNPVVMKAAGEGLYQGKGIIVKCPSGRRTWKAEVTLPGLGTTEFIFDVMD